LAGPNSNARDAFPAQVKASTLNRELDIFRHALAVAANWDFPLASKEEEVDFYRRIGNSPVTALRG